MDRKDRKQIKNQKHSIDITTFVSPVIFSIAFCAAIIADRCEFRIRDSNHAPGKKQFATIFPLTQQLPQQKKTNANPFFLKRHTHTPIFFRDCFFQETAFESFSDKRRFWNTSLQVIAGDAALIFSGESSPQATTDPWDWYIYRPT